MHDPRPRSRGLYVRLTLTTMILGLALRETREGLLPFVTLYLGDVLWAAMVFFLIATILPALSTRRVAIGAAVFSLVIELSQLYHAPWIDGIRQNRLGGLVLGFGFLWSDLVCYAVGIGLAALADARLPRVRD
ncbi:MAG TPA: DUF2809 domain-containing protein [Longimicrobium sp.]|jgi:hypothetical protein|uniref:ribosomal maturation YjgA family protein n=1 Tax=Longimicrobium sp. TaxID=2029185 RepID=UPI002ED7F9EF